MLLTCFYYIYILQIEDAICQKLTVEHLYTNLLFSIMTHLMMEDNINVLGCEEHAREITQSIIIFYTQCRMHFACNEANSMRQKKQKTKQFIITIKVVTTYLILYNSLFVCILFCILYLGTYIIII